MGLRFCNADQYCWSTGHTLSTMKPFSPRSETVLMKDIAPVLSCSVQLQAQCPV